MAKFYVQCGPLKIILTADSPSQAAISALDRFLQPHLWIYDDAMLSEQECRDHLMLEALMHLDPTLRISERGFDGSDAMQIGTPDAIDQWHSLMVGMRRLFIEAGLGHRTVVEVAQTSPQVQSVQSPRLPR